jgi:hypothetical protein
METQQNNQTSSAMAGQDTAVPGTAASAVTAGNIAGGAAGTIPAGSPVVAPKGFRSDLQQMLQGWLGSIPSNSALSTSVGTLTQVSVVTQLQAYLAAYSALDTNATSYQQTRAQVKAQLPQARQYFAALRAALRSFLGDQSPQLAQFGLTPGKTRKPLSTEKAAVKVAKLRATRALRGTKGPVARQATKSGPMQFVEPVTAPVAQPPANSAAASTAPAAATPGSAGK